MRPRLPLFLAIGIIAPAAFSGAMALEYCVTCAGPDATYRCNVAGAPDGRPQTGAQIRCISEIAKSGPHQSCSISRKHTGACEGELRTISIETAAPSGIEPSPTGTTRALVVPAEDMDTPPGTLIAPTLVPAPAQPGEPDQAVAQPPEQPSNNENSDPIGNAARSEGQSLENAGQAVGDAAKKSWDCVASLFSGC